MSLIAQLQTEIAGRKYRLGDIAAGIRAKSDHIRSALSNPIAGPDDVKFSVIAEIASSIEKLQEEYATIRREIRDLEKELRG